MECIGLNKHAQFTKYNFSHCAYKQQPTICCLCIFFGNTNKHYTEALYIVPHVNVHKQLTNYLLKKTENPPFTHSHQRFKPQILLLNTQYVRHIDRLKQPFIFTVCNICNGCEWCLRLSWSVQVRWNVYASHFKCRYETKRLSTVET